MKPEFKPKFKDGDTVRLTRACRVDRYWYDAERGIGSYDFAYLLPGLAGRVIHAKTPCVTNGPRGEPLYFANVDVAYMGKTYRVREFHDHFERAA